MKLALFDLDRTLLPIDSADTWSHYLVQRGGLDAEGYRARIREFSATYEAGCFDADAYQDFQMALLARFPRPQLEHWRAEFVRAHVQPHLRAAAIDLIDGHRQDGFTVAMVTGTNAFVSRPIATAFGFEHLLAVEPEEVDGRFTGRYVGTHTHHHGKVRAVEAFVAGYGLTLAQCEDSVFYSDSINDLPLLERVKRPVVTNGDAALCAIATERGWPRLELFAATDA